MTKNPQGISEKGEALYREKFQTEYEQKHLGKYLAIDVGSGEGFLGDSPEKAIEALLQKNSTAFYHVVRIGASGVYRVGYTQEASRDGIFR
ncbi:MAG TPA: hypothetical protein VHA06_19425 [Candidatus Angelobacter sp.]|nr:hypothetical protein [Candidatus Angelobacter sp.]